MDYVDLVFWMGLFLGIMIVLLVLGLLSYLKPSSNKPVEVPLHPFNYNNDGFHQLNLKLDQLLERARERHQDHSTRKQERFFQTHDNKHQSLCTAAYRFAKDLIWKQGIHEFKHPVRVNGVTYEVSLIKCDQNKGAGQ